MATHKFTVGQTVKLGPNRFASNRHPIFKVMELLSQIDGPNQYRIKSTWDGREYVVCEIELS
jgi:hypothetical protein